MRRLSIVIGSIAASLVALPLFAFTGATSSWAAPNCAGGTPAAGTSVTCTPSGGGYRDIVVPTGVGSISITADGGGGGKNESLSNGGSGARVSATLTVAPGQTIRVYVGSGGGAGLGGASNTGGTGYGNGGNGGPYYGEGFGGGYGGGGGGSSAVLVDGAVKLVAGGGGGGGSAYGGSATQNGANGGGDGSCARGGVGGQGGTAGTTSGTGNTSAATSGYAGRGGNGTYGAGGSSSGGGGGGAGYGGGGAGNWNGPYGCTNAGGGGAGGSYSAVSATFGSASNAGIRSSGSGNGGDGQVLITFIATPPTPPDAPTDLNFTNVTNTSIAAYWTPPVNDGGSTVTGYQVSVDGGTAVSTTSPTYTAYGLSSNVSHTFSVTAVNVAGSSSALGGSQATAASPPITTVPSEPMNMTISQVTATSITVNWDPPYGDGGSPITDYQFQIDGGPRSVCSPYSPCTGSPYTVTGLAPGSTHTFSVYARNINGSSLPRNITQTTNALAPPSEPTDLEFSGVTDTSITAAWATPASPGGSAISGYEVSVDGEPAVTVASTSYTATGLSPEAWHSFSITAVNADGPSPALEGSRSTTTPPVTQTPTTPPSTSPVDTGTNPPEKLIPTVSGVTLPKRIKRHGRTLLIAHALATNDGTPVNVKVAFTPVSVRGTHVISKGNGKVVIVVRKKAPARVTLILSAPETSASQAYTSVKMWQVRSKR